VVGWQGANVARAHVAAFRLDRYEVTVGRFRPFLAGYTQWLQQRPFGGQGAHPAIPGSGWKAVWTGDRQRYPADATELRGRIDKCNISAQANPASSITGWLDDATGANDRKPMTCVGFYEALLFCLWDEARLPTEAEWNFASAGGDAQYAYPWGTPAADNFVIEGTRGNVGPIASGLALQDVGTFPMGAGVWKQLDLAGNAYEWVQDTCAADCSTYDTSMVSNPLEMPIGSRVVRGGSYLWGPVNARTAYRKRVADSIVTRYEDVGWRCARDRP
jgi:sulfatase modifying factor 1